MSLLSAAISILFDGIAYAMLLFIIAVGLSVTMGLMNFVNLAHGAFAMAGGYATVSAMNVWQVPFLLALPLAFVLVAMLSVVLERLLYSRLYRRSDLDQVLMTIGLVFMAIAAFTFFFGPQPLGIRVPDFLRGQVDLGFRSFPAYRFFMIVVGVAMIVALWLTFERTLLGARIRAAVDNPRMAESLGINVGRLFTLTFAVGSGLAAVGGGLAVELIGMRPAFAIQYLVLFLIVVAVGGLGSLRGAFIAALVLGIADTAGKYVWPEGGGFFIYAITVAVLLAMPHGLYGKRE